MKKDNTEVRTEPVVVMVPIRCGDEIIMRPTVNTSREEDMAPWVI
jgi:hypothetical protein